MWLQRFLYVAFITFRDFEKQMIRAESTDQQSVLKAVMMNIFNPSPYIFWTLVTGPILLKGWRETPVYGIEFLAGFYVTLIGSLAAIILVFGLIRVYSSPLNIPFTEVTLVEPLTNFQFGTNVLIIGGYMVLGLPYMYRSVDTGMRTVDVRTLTEAAQSLGANWYIIIARVILPNIRTALLSGALLTFAIVLGEVVLASFLGVTAFGPYLFLLGQHRAYEPAALTFTTFLLTWAAMGIIQRITGGQGQVSGAH